MTEPEVSLQIILEHFKKRPPDYALGQRGIKWFAEHERFLSGLVSQAKTAYEICNELAGHHHSWLSESKRRFVAVGEDKHPTRS